MYHAKSWSYTSHFLEHQTNAREVAWEASVSVLFRRKGRAKNGASKRGGGGEERKEGNSFLPLPHPLLLFFASRFISRAAKTENLVPRSFFAPKQHGNACYAGYAGSRKFNSQKTTWQLNSKMSEKRVLSSVIISANGQTWWSMHSKAMQM